MKDDKEPSLTAAIITLIIVLTYLSGVCTVLYIAWHFVSKFW